MSTNTEEQDAPTLSAPESVKYPGPLLAWYTVGVLALLFWLALVDRYIIAFMVDDIRADLGISDFQFSLLQGLAFTVFYALCGLPLGWAIDRFSRRWVVVLGISIWSIATSLSGLAQSFPTLFAARMGVGAGEAVLNPSAYSILSDTFPEERIGLAMSVYAIGAALGSGFAYFFGGRIMDYVALQDLSGWPIISGLRPWQTVLFGLGLLGIPVSLLMFSIPEPKRLTQTVAVVAGKAQPLFSDIFNFLQKNWRFAVGHHLGFSFITIVSGGLTLWSPTYLIRTFDWSKSDAGFWLGLTIVAGGIIGAFVSGNIMDWLWKKGYRDAHLRWYFYVVLALIPIGLLMTLSVNPWIFLALKFVYHVLAASYSSAGGAAIAIFVPNRLRGRSTAVYMLVQNFIGNVLGAMLVAAFTDFLFHDDSKVGLSIALVFATALPLSAICLRFGMSAVQAGPQGVQPVMAAAK